ncbi:uncharacterized protein MAM_06496 [Metarhizium album ARSEF 1941]|uniref:Uncharacterized protein n=1 Tax=Metarhizium album (strain ARSEF 1941) TaxID=1081103 RepID=A0A0B2WRP4_METAS|nr:uncharacterized protein MAM_06496 [Metarhizium album ARSEF 1941]KHN95655.1 hypothetical protein MAM_06496 [Metarhizium album ARSEF 1941]
MGGSALSRRDGDAGALSLGGLLAIALCGGVVVFTSVGLLMAWRVKRRQKRARDRMYTLADEYSKTRLTKRPVVMSESAVSGLPSRLSSRFSLTLPPIMPLPPMLSYGNLGVFRSGSRRRGEEKDAKGGWFGRDGWIRQAQAPAVPALRAAEEGGDDDGIYDLGGRQDQQRPSYEEYRKQPMEKDYGGGYRFQSPSHGHGHGDAARRAEQEQQRARSQQPGLCVQKKRTGAALQTSQTTPNLCPQARARAQDDAAAARGRPSGPRPPARAHVRPSMTVTDVGLRDILRSTDQRLREGPSRSPTKDKTPRPSPTRSPSRCRPGSNAGRATGRHDPGTPSPSKHRPGGTVAVAALSTQASMASIGSAANSLIAEATHQLEVPDGVPSPSRLGGRRQRDPEPQGHPPLPPSLPGIETTQHTPNHSPQRSPQRSAQRSPQPSPPKRRSVDSDQSSSLSTLYSVGEPENEEQEIQRQYFLQQQRFRREELEALAAGRDPFVDNGDGDGNGRARSRPARQTLEQPAGPRPLRRIKTMSPSVRDARADASPVSQPLRPLSLNSKGGPGRGIDLQVVPPRPLMLRASDAARPRTPQPQPQPRTASDASFASDSVNSDDSGATALPACETPRPEWVAAAGRRGSPPTPAPGPLTPGRQGDGERDGGRNADFSSSPFSEHEILSMLLASGGAKRALPLPPSSAVTCPDGSVLATGLSPRPSVKSPGGSSPHRRRSSGSCSISLCSSAADAAACGSPPGRRVVAGHRSSRDGPPALGTTIAQLRRMNSLVSSYSAASVASTVAVGDADSPTLPCIFTSLSSPLRQRQRQQQQQPPCPRPEDSGSRYYLNVGAGTLPKHRSLGVGSSPGRTGAGTGTASRNAVPHHRKGRSEDVLPMPKLGLGLGLGPSPAGEQEGKENQRVDGLDASGDQARPSPRPSLPPPCSPSSPTTYSAQVFRLRQGPVGDLLAREMRPAKRDSVDSLGLYDEDGFLLPSPERDARALRARALRV